MNAIVRSHPRMKLYFQSMFNDPVFAMISTQIEPSPTFYRLIQLIGELL